MSKKSLIFSNFDSPKNPYFGGGGARAIHAVARRLSDTYGVTVVTGKYPGWKDETVDGVMYRHIGSRTTPLIDQAVFHISSVLHAIRGTYDVWLENFTPPCITGLIPLFSGKSVIGLAHMLPGKDMARKYHLPFEFADTVGLRAYRTIIATSEFFAGEIRRMNKKAAVHVVPNGVEEMKITNRQRNHILWMGRIEVDQKGLDLLIEAYARVKDAVRLPLVLAGSGTQNQVALLKKKIQTSGAGEMIKWIDRVDGIGKTTLFADAAAVIVSSRFETFSLVASEALMAGVPLVTFDIAGLRWVPHSHRFVAADMTPESLSREIARAVTDREVAMKKAARGYEAVKINNWDNIAAKYRKIIAEII